MGDIHAGLALRGLCLRKRQPDRKGATMASFAGHRKGAAMAQDDALRARQTDARAADAADDIAATPERLEHKRQVLGWNAESLIGDDNRHPAVLSLQRQQDTATRRAELDRVAEQVVEDSFEPGRIKESDDFLRIHFQLKLVPAGGRLMLLDRFTTNLDQVCRLEREVEVLHSVNRRDLEQLVD